MLIMCEDSYTLFMHLFVCVCLCLLIHMYLYTVQSFVLLTVCSDNTVDFSHSLSSLYRDSKHMLRKHRGLNYSSLFPPPQLQDLEWNENNINLSIHAAAHLRKRSMFKCHSKYHIETLSSHQLIFFLCLLWNFLKAISHSACFSGKRKSVIWFVSVSMEKAWT